MPPKQDNYKLLMHHSTQPIQTRIKQATPKQNKLLTPTLLSPERRLLTYPVQAQQHRLIHLDQVQQ